MMEKGSKSLLVLLLCLFAPLSLSAQKISERPSITVSAEGEVKVEPDEAKITLGIEITEMELDAARTAAAEKMRAIIEALKAGGVDEKDVQTDRLNIRPVYNYAQEERTLRGYQIQQNVTVNVREIESFESILTGALDAGANFVHGIEFKSSEKKQHLEEARSRAMMEALRKAQSMAGVLNQGVGRPLTIMGGDGRVPPPMPYAGGVRAMRMDQAESASMEGTIAPGEITYTADVTIAFELIDQRGATTR